LSIGPIGFELSWCAGKPGALGKESRKAEVVVQDVAAYQRLVELAARADREETVAAIREGLADAEAGRVKPARKALKALAKKYGIPDLGE
jgi:hypothetical protein